MLGPQFGDISIQNFLPFRDAVCVNLTQQGLVLVQGRNDVSASSRNNGCGKSALIDAISWVLFEAPVSARGASVDSVVNRFSDEPCLVELDFTIGGKTYHVSRQRRPLRAELTCGSRTLAQQKDVTPYIEGLLGFGYHTFCTAVVFGQGAFTRFALASHADKLGIFDEVLGLDFRAAEKACIDDRRSINATIADLTQTATTLDERIADLEAVIAEDAEAKAESADLATRVRKKLAAIPAMRLRVVELTKLRATARTLSQSFDLSTQGLREAQRESQYAGQALADTERRLQTLRDAKACPTCRQPTTTDLNALPVWQLEIQTETDALRRAEAKVTKARAALELATRNLRAFERANVSPFSRLDEEYAEKAPRCSLEAEDVLREQLAGYTRVGKTATKRAAQLRALQAERAALDPRIEKATRAVRIADYWSVATGPRGLRPMAVRRAATFFNQRLAEYTARLTGGEAICELRSDMVRGVETLVISGTWAWGSGSYEGQSNGQHRRCDLAAYLALLDLAEKHAERPFPLRGWDQPEEGLDVKGLELFGAIIQEQATQSGTGLLITHHPDLVDAVRPDQIWTFVMTRNGAHVEIA